MSNDQQHRQQEQRLLKQSHSPRRLRRGSTAALVVLVAVISTLLSPVVGGSSSASANEASSSGTKTGDRYEAVIQDGEFYYVLDATENTKAWAGHCTDQLGSPRAVVWDDVKDIPETETPSCDVIAGMLATNSAPAPAAPTQPAPVQEQPAQPSPVQEQPADSDRYEAVIQDGEYYYILDATANTKTWAGHCTELVTSPRAVVWDDVKDIPETETPSCDVIAGMLGSSPAPAPAAPSQPAPVQEQPVQEQPAQEEPAQPSPVQEQPVQEQPVQEERAQEEPAQEQPVQERSRIVVSMGDSFISGESGHLIGNNSAQSLGFGVYEPGTEIGCRRSDDAPINSASIPNLTAVNIACSGAVTADIGQASQSRDDRGHRNQRLQIHQLEDLAAQNNIEMVAVSIGGNDAGFAEFTTSCVLAFALNRTCEDTATPFEDRVKNQMKDQVAASVNEIRSVLDAAGQTDTRIVLLSYPSPVPASTNYDSIQRLNHGCNFTASDMRYVRTTFVPLLDETLEGVAERAGVDFLSLANSFEGKEVCSPDVTGRDETADHSQLEWATGVRGRNAESMHPNALGQRAVGQCLRLVFFTSSAYNFCYNNGGDPSDMRLGSRNEVTFDAPAPITTECADPSSDPDGDGWGWENGQGCLVTLDDVTCEVGSEGLAERVCRLLLTEINQDLENAELSLDQAGLLFSYHDPEDSKISGSCSNRLYVTDQRVDALVSSDTDISLETGTLEDPIALSVSVPFSVDVRARFRSEQNYRFFGSCNNGSSDSYTVTGNGSGTAEMTAIFDLGTEINPLPNGDIAISVTPDILVDFDLNDPDIDDIRASGVNPLAQAVGAAGTIISGTTDLTGWIFGGDSLSDILTQRGIELGINAGAVAISPGPGLVVSPLLEDFAEYRIDKEARGITSDAETELMEQIDVALELDENGQKTWVVPAELADLLRSGGDLEDLLTN